MGENGPMVPRILLAVLAFALASIPARAEVADSSAGGFTVRIALTIQASPDVVYRRLMQNVGEWWNSTHTFSGSSHNLSIEEKAPGCFCEKLPDGGGVRHMEIVHLVPGKAVVMSGALGPMQSLGAAGSLRIQLSATGDATKFEATYAVGGYTAAGMNTWAAPVDGMLKEQFTRLKNYIEHGDPASPSAPAK